MPYSLIFLVVDAVFYLWFEAFPVVFVDIYHFELGLTGLPFLGFLVTGTFTVSIFGRVVYISHLARVTFSSRGTATT
jgi:hypothetical protein